VKKNENLPFIQPHVITNKHDFLSGNTKKEVGRISWQSLFIFVASFHTMKVIGDYYHPVFGERNHAILKGGEGE